MERTKDCGEWVRLTNVDTRFSNGQGQGLSQASDTMSYSWAPYLTPQETTFILKYYSTGLGLPKTKRKTL